MKILIAEDDLPSSRMLESTLRKWGHQVVVTYDGDEAWSVLQSNEAPHLVILDIVMPGKNGIEICKKIREMPRVISPYVILLTAKSRKEDVVVGLEAGADDYVSKPFDLDELRARVSVGLRMLELQEILANRVSELEEALTHVKRLQGMLPICSYCKSIRGDSDYWQSVEEYISEHSDAQFTHSICPGCYQSVVEPQLDKMRLAGNSD